MTTFHTFEASPFWRTVLGRAFVLRECAFEGDGFTLLTWKHPLYGVRISTPFRDRAAILWHGERRRLPMDEIRKAVGAAPILIKDLQAFAAVDPTEPDPEVQRIHVNSDVSLSEGILKRLSRSGRREWKRTSETLGLQCVVNPPDVFEDWRRLYLMTRRRLGVLPYPRRFFNLLFSAIGREVLLLQALFERRPVGYLLCYLHGDEMISAHIGYDASCQKIRVADFLYVQAFLWGQKNGYASYRFGGDYRTQTALLYTKQKLGAVPREQADFSTRRERFGSAVEHEGSLIRRTLRAMPRRLFPSTEYLIHFYFD